MYIMVGNQRQLNPNSRHTIALLETVVTRHLPREVGGPRCERCPSTYPPGLGPKFDILKPARRISLWQCFFWHVN